MGNKYHADIDKPESVDIITYVPYRIDSGDRIATTKTITATAEASGVGNADYSFALTLTAPTDARLVVQSIITRLALTIDSDDGTHDLCCRVYMDAQDADHLLFDIACTTTGAQLAAQRLTTGVKDIIYNLIKNGAAHTYYMYFWSPGNHSPVLSLAQMWGAVGTNKTAAWGYKVVSFTPDVDCELQVRTFHYCYGTGTQCWTFILNHATSGNEGLYAFQESGVIEMSGATQGFNGTYQLLPAGMAISLHGYGTVATDMQYIHGFTIFMKRLN